MKTGLVEMKKTLTVMAAVALLAILSGCGGGGSMAPAGKSNYGRMAAELHFNGREAGRAAGVAATGTVNIAITISGDYGMDDSAFPTLTAQTQIDAAGGIAQVSIIEVPIGVNHLLSAVATWPDGATETIKCIIPEVREGELTPAVADYRTTVIANAAMALAERDEVKLSKITQSQIDTLAAAVDAFLAAGYAAGDININDVLAYETTGSVISSVAVSPDTATVLVGATAQFTATPKNAYGIAVAGTVTWSVTGSLGTIDTNGLFTASAVASGTVVATSGTISGSAQVTVTSSTPATVCGNGTIESGETCDDGASNGLPNYCNATCNGTTGSVCGNSVVEAGETCDDGNTTTETCTYGQTSCTVCDSSCASAAGALTGFCGDSTINGSETCDDGANNGLPNYCNTTCNGTTGSVCGNSMVEAGETCDDGNTTTETCTYGQTSCTVCNASCASAAGALTGYCGDSTINGSETCDDGANNGLPNYCNATCNGTTGSVCGNSVVEAGETCDDGNTTTETCTYGQTSCTVCNSSCASAAGALTGYCGDSTINGSETCDDGNSDNTDTCLDTCVAASCGDGYTQSGETCDDGNTTSNDGCSSTCQNDAVNTNAWLTIPAGDFVMGCATADVSCNGDGREGPKHTVTLPAYKIQKYEVTNAQYALCVAASACAAPSSANSATRTPYYGNATYDNYPVTYVDWNRASAYCAWISGRLPTEAEWEKAARGPSPNETIHTWGAGAANCTLANYSGCTGDTDDVASRPTGASYYGALNMMGNVKEWVNDWYAINYYTTGGPPWTDPQGPGSGSYHVLRGGSWYGGVTELRASERDAYTGTDYGYGFRCAQD